MFGPPKKVSGVVSTEDIFYIRHRELDKITKPSYILMRATVQIRKGKMQISSPAFLVMSWNPFPS